MKKDAISKIRAYPDFQKWLKKHESEALSGLVEKLDETEGAVLLEIINPEKNTLNVKQNLSLLNQQPKMMVKLLLLNQQ